MKLQRILYTVIIMLACMSWAPSVKADSSKFTIEKYHVNITVTKENTYKIQEKITVNFTEPQHGIYRDIPKINEIYRPDGSKGKTIVELKSVSCGGAAYQTKENEKNYQIKNLGMVYGKNGSDQKDGLSYRVEGKSIYGELDPSITLQEGEGVTVRLVLPEGYFDSKFRIKFPMYVALGVGVFGVLFSFGLWWKIGRDDPVNVSMECNPPNGMNSLEMAFVYKGNVNSKDIVSLVVYLAQKGYIQIWEGESTVLL